MILGKNRLEAVKFHYKTTEKRERKKKRRKRRVVFASKQTHRLMEKMESRDKSSINTQLIFHRGSKGERSFLQYMYCENWIPI